MKVQLAEAAAEGLLLLGGQLLIAEEKDAMLGEGLVQRADLFVVESLR
jgi:hypothetical protein